MGKTDAEVAPTGQELPAELILAYLASGCRVNRTQATAALSELISVGLLACRDGRYSLPKAPAPASPPASHRRGGPPHRSLPDTGVTYREHPADVGPFWRRPTSCKPATKARSSEVKPGPQRRSGKRGQRAHPRYRTLEKYI
jgi:hypothetical protein